MQIKCPQDAIIIRLNTELNKTYLWYGDESIRTYNCASQAAQDANASALGGGVIVGRAAAKATAAYDNRSRDLVDAISDDKDVLSKVKTEELPEQLQKLPAEDRSKYVTEMAGKRAELQRQIAELSQKRAEYIAHEQKKLAADSAATTLGDAVVTAIQQQLTDSGFEQAN